MLQSPEVSCTARSGNLEGRGMYTTGCVKFYPIIPCGHAEAADWFLNLMCCAVIISLAAIRFLCQMFTLHELIVLIRKNIASFSYNLVLF